MARSRTRRSTRARGWPGRIFGWLIRAFFIFVVGSLLWVLLYKFVPPPITITQAGDVLGGRTITRDWMSLERIDRDMIRAAIAGEDGKFCSHRGFDTDAIAEAMRRNAQGGRIRGGSTISQQTAKNAFLWQGGGYIRKGFEAWFTLLIENIWGKRRIMEVYLNIAETGIGTYGANAGAQRYFRHDASTLSRTEAARIAAVLPLPKKRGAVTPKGFTRRYGNSISARIGVVQRDGLDACVYESGEAPAPSAAGEPKSRPKIRRAPPAMNPPAIVEPVPPPPSDEVPGEEYEEPAQTVEETPPLEEPADAIEETPPPE